MLNSFAQAERAVSQPLTQLLALGREANALQTRVNRASAAVTAQITAIDRRLWQRDTDNLFSAVLNADLRRKLDLSPMFEEMRDESDLVDEFDRNSRAVHNGVLVLALLLLPVILLLSSRAKQASPTTRHWSATARR